MTDTTDPTDIVTRLRSAYARYPVPKGVPQLRALAVGAADEIESLRAQLAAARRTEAETKAAALREAADFADNDIVNVREYGEYGTPFFNGARHLARRLRSRAAALLAQPED